MRSLPIHPSKLLLKMSAIAISAYRICIFTPTSFELDITISSLTFT
ncbi:hypothetical protein [Nostoc sp.]